MTQVQRWASVIADELDRSAGSRDPQALATGQVRHAVAKRNAFDPRVGRVIRLVYLAGRDGERHADARPIGYLTKVDAVGYHITTAPWHAFAILSSNRRKVEAFKLTNTPRSLREAGAEVGFAAQGAMLNGEGS